MLTHPVVSLCFQCFQTVGRATRACHEGDAAHLALW